VRALLLSLALLAASNATAAEPGDAGGAAIYADALERFDHGRVRSAAETISSAERSIKR